MPKTKEQKTIIEPLQDRVIIRRIEEQEQMQCGLYIPDVAKEKPQEGEVIAVGQGRVLDNGTQVKLTVKTGDRVLFGKYAGIEIRLDGEDYLIMREDDILGRLNRAHAVAHQ